MNGYSKIYFVITSCLFLQACTSTKPVKQGFESVANPMPVQEPTTSLTIPAPNQLHGVGLARYSNFDESRAYSEARENAKIDFAANMLTSVYLEYYGTNTQPTQLQAEFGIADTLESKAMSVLDSTQIGDWAVYFVDSPEFTSQLPTEVSSIALGTDWDSDYFEPVNIQGFWIASGWVQENEYNPNRGWTQARQEALKNLSLHRSSVVQANERLYNDVYRSINYTTSKHVFREIHPIGRRLIEDKIFVLLAVKDSNIVQINQ